MKNITALISGVVFGIGLTISGMINPKKVIGFLDITSSQTTWDVALAFVMGGAVIVGLLSTLLIRMMKKPLCETLFHLPTNKIVDKKLVFGAALFGVGWGIAGICPGPGLVNLIQLNTQIFGFIIAMLVGQFVITKYVR